MVADADLVVTLEREALVSLVAGGTDLLNMPPAVTPIQVHAAGSHLLV